MMPRVDLQCAIVIFPDQTGIFFWLSFFNRTPALLQLLVYASVSHDAEGWFAGCDGGISLSYLMLDHSINI